MPSPVRLLRPPTARDFISSDDVSGRFGGLFFTPIRQKIEQEARRVGTGLKLRAFESVRELLRENAAFVPADQSVPPVPEELLTAALQVNAPRDTGALSDSLEAIWNADLGKYEVYSHGIPYGRIQDYGGLTGKNHASLLAGHEYTAKAAADVGIDPSLVVWGEPTYA